MIANIIVTVFVVLLFAAATEIADHRGGLPSLGSSSLFISEPPALTSRSPAAAMASPPRVRAQIEAAL
ncbi:hypothetical protein E2542_SST22466 [Spatholobus suberectus]|nr:hypothetical protein E2542_SST22466 [Spatholobus suberectus]